METEVSEAGNAYSAEGDSLLLDPDLYDADAYDIPDPGLLKEKNELFTEPIPRRFTGSSWWQNQTPRARARQLWLLLRGGLHDFVEKEKRSELCVARLTHGLEPLRHLKVAAGLCSVAQDPVGRRFVVLDGVGNLHVHREDGWADKKLRAPAMLTGLVAMQGPLDTISRFVGWGPEGLAILRPDLSLLWLSEPGVGRVPGHEPICCLPVPSLRLLLVAEAGGSLVLWEFRSGGRRLVPRGSPLQLPPSPAGTLTRLVLGPPHSHQTPCCFAAYGSAVLTFDLHTWALADVRRDLHKTTIWDVAYCLEVGALVTASRDSTVKVWEADWQIRMVFMGHTGPVTALAVLPNTSRVLSASRDGTLRTWDLQTAAQVGEVALSCRGRGAACGLVTRLLAPAGPGWPVLSLSTSGVGLWRLRELYSPLAQLSAPVLHLQLVPALPASAHPLLPARLVCACADGSVYLVAAATGRTVSALLLEPDDRAASVLYCLPREALWLLTRAGHLVCADAARCPMRVLRRVCPPAAPARRPCCLHLYSHLTDPGGARASWQAVCRRAGEPGRRDAPRAWKDKNRYLPVLGHTDGALSVLEWRRSKTVFQTEAHSPGPVTAIASTWNSVVSSGGDLTVKMWRVYPYAEESLSLLRTFSCCHPAVGLCALGRRITVAFENPDSATYGLVQFGLGDSPRSDHRPQDDPTDHITGLCCCPSLRLYACSSLDCSVRIWTAENRLLRLLQLNGPPQGLTFSSDSGDLVLALGSWLCLVSHRLYLPTSYLVKSLCQKVPDVVPDPPLPLTSQESLTPAQLQRLANLQGTPSLSPDSASIHRQTATPPRPVLEEDLEALAARDRGLQQLRLGLVVPTAPPPPSWQQRQEAFDNYLHLIYGRGLLDVPPGREFQQWSTTTLTVERETWDVCTVRRVASGLWQPRVCTEGPTAPAALARQEPGAMGRRFAHPPRVPLPIPATRRGVHSRASQLLARSLLSSNLGLSLDLQLQWERLRGKKPVVPDSLSLHLQHRVPLLKKRRPHEPLSNLRGCFPATIRPYKPSTHLLASPVWALLFFSGDRLPEGRRFPEKAPGQAGASASRVCPHTSSPDLRRPIGFPGSVPNSVVLRQLWLRREVSSPGAFAQLTGHRRPKPGRHHDDLWQLRRIRRPGAKGQQDLAQWLGEEEQEGRSVDWFSDSLSPHGELSESEKTEAQSSEYFSPKRTHSRTAAGSETGLRQPLHSYGHALWEERSGYLPRLLHFFVGQNWFKELFPVFTLEAYPEVGTAEGLASMFMDALCEASWTDRVHVLRALLRLLPDLSRDLRNRLQGLLVGLLNLDEPPSLQDQTQKEFVMLALQLLLACSLESREVVLELLSFFLYSPASCRPELRKLLDGLGLQDPPGFLFKEMMTWVQGPDADSKAALRKRCCHKLEEMIQRLQMQHLQPSVANLSEMLLKVSQTAVFLPPPKEALARISVLAGSAPVSGTAPVRSWVSSLVVSPRELNSAVLQSRAKLMPSPRCLGRTKRGLSEALSHFWPPKICACSSAPDVLPEELPPLEQTDWSRSQMLDLETIDALNFFCKQLQARAQLQGLPQEQLERPRPSPCPPEYNTVLPQPRERWHYPILRLQEAKVQKPPMKLRSWKRSRLWVSRTVSGSIRMLKLPLPRAEVRPFPPDWPRPTRPLPPLLLQPTLQRYFLPEDTDPDSYS